MHSHSDGPVEGGESKTELREQSTEDDNLNTDTSKTNSKLKEAYIWICTVLLLVNYFLAQYDKFILSYFQTPLSESLNL